MSAVPSVSVEKKLDPSFQEQHFVHDVYNDIAPHFSQTRYKPWPIVEEFLKSRPDYAVGLDVGCGNGKYLGVNPKLFMVGTDRSEGLVTCAQEISDKSEGELSYNLGVADGLSLPHPNDSFDFAISIAVIHHFANEERRVEAIRHILSKLKVGGELLVYCWALEQESSRRGYKEGDEQDILIPWVKQIKQEKKKTKKPKRSRKDMTEEQIKEEREAEERARKEKEEQEKIEKEKETKYRYYHLYKKGELSENAVRAGGSIVREGYEKDNWWTIIRREAN
ncbi:tRNA (carboxymethyluridine(34)-5-O)-methyltransferase [[Candida] anglica]|uniref:tRNA (Carboxymethyluridine(34)-5-O)-methyltransferase n=1 Tax=[Candida] anglica TaxID=148631 RepID=A0ABP0EFT2_9ASCO